MKFLFSSVMILSFARFSFAGANDWQPVTAADLQLNTKLDPLSDAEILFWEVRAQDRDGQSLTMDHYLRIKIFTDRGKERYSTVEIPVYGKRSVTDIAARTVKPDGAVHEMKSESIFERELVKTKGLKVRGMTMALPGVEVGDIIEYRYREQRKGTGLQHLRLYFQKELPMRRVTYHLIPPDQSSFSYSLQAMSFHCPSLRFEVESPGISRAAMENVPAFVAEPDMPPADQVIAWVLLYYDTELGHRGPNYWKELGKEDYEDYKKRMKFDGSVKSTASEITSGVDDSVEKLRALDRFCRMKVRNVSADAGVPTLRRRANDRQDIAAAGLG